jgi:hypothetical protein
MTKIDLNGATSVVLPDGRELQLNDLRTRSELQDALDKQARKFHDEYGPANELFQALKDPEAQQELAAQLVKNLGSTDPEALRSYVEAAGLDFTPAPTTSTKDETPTGSSSGFDMSSLARVVEEAVASRVAPLEAQLRQRDSRAVVEKELADIRSQYPELKPEEVTSLLQLAADKSSPGNFRLSDAARLSRYEELLKENQSLKEERAKATAMDMFPGLVPSKPSSAPATEAVEKFDYSTDEGKQKGAEAALSAAMAAMGVPSSK